MVNNSNSNGEAYDWSGGWRLKKKQLEDDIARKNAQLNQFMDDIQRLEEESRLQEATVATLRSRLQETTDEVDGLAADYSAIKETNQHLQEVLLEAQESEAGLRAQLEEALQHKQEQQQQQTALSAAVEERLDRLQTVLLEREQQLQELQEVRIAERQELRQQQSKFAQQAAAPAVTRMQKELESNERQVSKLSSKLTQAAAQIEESAAIIEQLREKSQTNTSEALKEQVHQLRKQLQQERQHVSRLKLQLLSAEEDAQMHARDLAAVSESLHAYMSGELSLADAVKELKACRSQLARRDAQVAQLTAMTNTLQIHVQEIMDENTHLRTQLRLEPRESLPGPGGSSSKWQNSKQTIAKLSKRIKHLEEDKINLRTEVFALMREVANQRGIVQITSLEVPVREALASLVGGLGYEAEAQLREVREAVTGLGLELQGLTGTRIAGSGVGLPLPPATEKARQKAQQIIGQLRKEIDAVTEEAERSRDEVKTQQRTLASYRKQFTALLAEVSSLSAHYKDPVPVMEDPSVESGQVNVTDSYQPMKDDDPSSRSVGEQRPNLKSLLHHPSFTEKSSVFGSSQMLKDDNLGNLLTANLTAVTECQERVMAALEAIRTEMSIGRFEDVSRLLVPHTSHLLLEVFDERRAIVTALSKARDLQFDTSVVLRQVQVSSEHLEQMREVYTNEQTEQNVARWCQSFHKQRLANIELKEKVGRLSDETGKMEKALAQKEKQMEEILQNMNKSEQTRYQRRELENSSGNLGTDQNFATIAVQTVDLSQDEEYSSKSRYDAENKIVLAQAITDLEKQRALNVNLQRLLREKELTIISKEQYLNKLKSEMVLSKQQETPTPGSPSTTSRDANTLTTSSEDDKAYIEHLKSSAEESRKTIFRYQILLEKAHKELQDESNQHKEEVTSVVKERDAALKKVKELQFCLDSIPCRDTDIGQQQHIVFVEQVQSLNETIRLLEKQFSSSRIEKSELELRVDGLKRMLKEEQEIRQHEKERQEVACKIKSQNLELDNKRLAEEMNNLRQEADNWKSQALHFKNKSPENPSVVLMALVEKMREKLIEKDNYIATMKKRQM